MDLAVALDLAFFAAGVIAVWLFCFWLAPRILWSYWGIPRMLKAVEPIELSLRPMHSRQQNVAQRRREVARW